MILKVLFIQRYCRYPEEYGPEALACVDEFCFDENPEWFEDEVKKQLALHGDSIAGYTVVDIEVSMEKIRQLCLPRTAVIKGEIK